MSKGSPEQKVAITIPLSGKSDPETDGIMIACQNYGSLLAASEIFMTEFVEEFGDNVTLAEWVERAKEIKGRLDYQFRNSPLKKRKS